MQSHEYTDLLSKCLLEETHSEPVFIGFTDFHDLLFIFLVVWPALELHILVQPRQLLSLVADRSALGEIFVTRSTI